MTTTKDKKRSERHFGAFSFVFIYCWYDTYGRHFEDSPVAAALGPLTGTVKTLVSLAVIVGVAVALILPWQRIVEQRWPLKLAVHLLVFLPFYLFPFFASFGPVILLSLIGGFCLGAVMARSLYTMFFEIMDLHPAKIIVVGYAIIQIFVHISDIIPLVSVPLLYYAISALCLLTGMVLSYLRVDGEEMERRRILPENRFWLADNWHILLMILMIQSCLTVYVIFLKSTTFAGFYVEALNIIPDVVVLLLLAVFGKRFTLVGSMIAFLTLFAASLSSYVLLGSDARIPMQLFMEPAYRIVDFLFVWILIVVFYTYGRNQIRLKVCLAVFFAVRFAGIAAFETLFITIPPSVEAAFFTLLPVLFTALLLPSAQHALKSMEDQRAYAERQQVSDVPLPPQQEYVQAALAALTQALPQNQTLTKDEQTALCYCIDGQNAEMTAYFMGVTYRRVRELNKALLQKFNMQSVNELMVKLGQIQSAGQSKEALFERYSLTDRERQITLLLLTDMPAVSIAKELAISKSTVNFHSTNLYRKLGIQSRAQLMTLFMGAKMESNSENYLGD